MTVKPTDKRMPAQIAADKAPIQRGTPRTEAQRAVLEDEWIAAQITKAPPLSEAQLSQVAGLIRAGSRLLNGRKAK